MKVLIERKYEIMKKVERKVIVERMAKIMMIRFLNIACFRTLCLKINASVSNEISYSLRPKGFSF